MKCWQHFQLCNYTIENKLVGGYQAVNSAVPLNLDPGEEIYNKTQESLMTSSRPKYKFILGFDVFANKFSLNLEQL